MIEVKNLTRKFNGLVAVDHVNFEVDEGRIFGYLGLNGAGKTTTIKMLTTIIPPTEGTAKVCGFDVVRETLEVRKQIGVVSEEEKATKPGWTPYQYLLYFGTLYGLTRDVVEERATAFFRTFDLLDVANKKIGELSGGMKKKVEICRAMLSHPKVLFLDEPTKDLDIPTKREMWEMLRNIATQEKIAIFLCSHDIYEINELCDDICIIAKGKITFQGSLEELKAGKGIKEVETSIINLLEG